MTGDGRKMTGIASTTQGLALALASGSAGPARIDLPVLGMTCAACVRHVEKALQSVDGVGEASVNLALERATVVIDPSRTSPAALVEAIREAGYDVPGSYSVRAIEPTRAGEGAP